MVFVFAISFSFHFFPHPRHSRSQFRCNGNIDLVLKVTGEAFYSLVVAVREGVFHMLGSVFPIFSYFFPLPKPFACFLAWGIKYLILTLSFLPLTVFFWFMISVRRTQKHFEENFLTDWMTESLLLRCSWNVLKSTKAMSTFRPRTVSQLLAGS